MCGTNNVLYVLRLAKHADFGPISRLTNFEPGDHCSKSGAYRKDEAITPKLPRCWVGFPQERLYRT